MQTRWISRLALGVVAVASSLSHAQTISPFPQPVYSRSIYVMNSLTHSVWQFSGVDGTLLNTNVWTDNTLVTPLEAIQIPNGHFIVAAQGTGSGNSWTGSGVWEYDAHGLKVRTFGDVSTGLLNVHGIEVYKNQLYVTVGNGTYGGTVQRFNLDGTGQTTFISTHLIGPWAIKWFNGKVLVTNYDSATSTNNVEEYDANGNWITSLVSSNGSSGLHFPEQIALDNAGGFLVAGFSLPDDGVFDYSATGTQLSYVLVSGARGVYKLANGSVFATGGTNINIVKPDGSVTTTIYSGSSFRFVSAGAVLKNGDPIILDPPPSL